MYEKITDDPLRQWTEKRRGKVLQTTVFKHVGRRAFLLSVSPEAHVYKASGLIPETCVRRFEFDVNL